MNQKKLLTYAMTGVMVIGLLSGCGNSKGGTQETTANEEITAAGADVETAAPEASEEAAADTQISGGGNAKEVSVWHYFEHEAAALEKMADAYNELQDDIHITCTYVSRDELMNQYTIGAVSGELPDIGMVDSPDMASYIALGVFEDIDAKLREWGDLDKFYQGPLSSCEDSEGKLHGLPNNSNCLALLCNMDILNEAGFDEPPTTWDEFYEVAKACTNPDDSVYGFAMCAIGNEEGTFQYIPWLYSSGANVTSLDSEQAAKSMDFLAGLVSDGYMSKEVINWTQGDGLNAFAAGKAAMYESGTWNIAQFDLGDVVIDFNYKYAMLPKDEEYATVIGGENFGVCTGSDAREECIEFLKFMMQAENNADWCEVAGKLPVRSDAMELKDFWTQDERYAVFSEAMDYAVARGPHESWPTISEAIYTAEQAALLGEKSGVDAMKAAADIVNPILEEVPIAE